VGSKTVRDNYFYEILAQRLSIGVPDDESAMARGVRMEPEARAEYEKRTKKKVEEVGFIESDDNKDLGASPDGYIKKKVLDHAIEIKCLSGANHLRAYMEKVIPRNYYPQGIQQFIVNEKLKTLDFVFYDPRIPALPYHVITMKRKDVAHDIEHYKKEAEVFLKEVSETLETLTKI